MRKFFSFGNKKRRLPMRRVPFNSPLWYGLGLGTEKNDEVTKSQQGYNIQEKELKKIHRAAIVGNVAEVEWILLHKKNTIDKRDRMNRTSLHLACANGHSDVVTLLVERKCQLNLYDNEDRTALMKAVQCQEERCLSILLEHGADPNLTDSYGSTALHYAVIGENISIAEKLLLHHANIEAKNEFGLTPFLLAVKKNNEQMVEFLIGKKANIHAVDKSKRTALMLAVTHESSNVTSLLLQQGVNISSQDICGWTAEEHASISGFEGYCQLIAKHREERRLKNSSQNNDPDLVVEGLFDNERAMGKKKKPMVEKNSEEDSVSSISIKPGDNIDSSPTSNDEEVDFNIKKGETQPAIGKKGDGLDITESALQERTINENLTAADRAHKNNRHALGLEEKDGESPGDSERMSSSLSEKNIDHFSGTTEQKGPGMLHEQVEDVICIPSGSRDFGMAKPKETSIPYIPVSHTESLEKYTYLKPTVEVKDSVSNKPVKMKEKQTSKSGLSDWKSTGLNYNNGTYQISRHLKVDDKCPSVSQSMTKNPSASTEFKQATLIDKKKINDIGAVFMFKNYKLHDVGESQLPENREHKEDLPAELDLKMTTEEEGERLDESENKHLEVEEQIDSVDVHGDSTPPSEITKRDSHSHCSNYTISMSLIEQHGMGCKDSIGLLKIKDAILSYDKLVELKKNHSGQLERENEKLKKKVNKLQKQLSKTKEMTLQLELQKVRWEQELPSLRFSLKQEKEERKTAEEFNKIIQEELKEKKEQYYKEVEMKQQLDHNLRALDEELRTVRNDFNKISNSHENHMWQDQVAMLRLEIETINKENWKKERKYCEDIEMVKENNVSLQKAIKRKEETLTKTISQYSGQINALTAENTMLKSKLETEKQDKERLDARVESYQAGLAAAIQDHGQSQTSKRDLELAFQRAKDEWFRVQEKLNFEVSSLKDNNELLSQNLSKAESKLNTLEVELHHTRDALREKTLVLERVQRDLGQTQCQKKEIEHMYQNEQDKVSKYIGTQESLTKRLSQLQSENMLLQQQLTDAHNKSKEKIVINIQDQFQDIIKKIQTESQKQTRIMEEKNKELTNEYNLLKERMCEYEKEKTEREIAVRQLQGDLADALKKQSMSKASLEVTSHCHRNLEDEAQVLKEKLAQLRSLADHLTAKLETVSSENQTLTQELSMKEIQMKCKKREENKKKLEQVANLKSSMEANIEVGEIERYKQDLEERAKLDTEKLKQAILFLQTQVASQESLLVHLIENSASLGNQMELRLKGLEFALFKMRSSQEGSNKMEVEHYRQRYLAEEKLRMSLSSELNRTNENLAETRTKLLMEKQWTQTLLDASHMRPSLHLPYGRNVDSSLLFNRSAAPWENIAIPSTSSRPSNNGIETFLTKMQQELQENITRELKEAAVEFESDSFGAASFLDSPCGSHPNYDVIRARKDFEQCLKRNYKL